MSVSFITPKPPYTDEQKAAYKSMKAARKVSDSYRYAEHSLDGTILSFEAAGLDTSALEAHRETLQEEREAARQNRKGLTKAYYALFPKDDAEAEETDAE